MGVVVAALSLVQSRIHSAGLIQEENLQPAEPDRRRLVRQHRAARPAGDDGDS